MKKLLYLMLAVVAVGAVCSCGNKQPQVDEQAIKDSIAKAIEDSVARADSIKAVQDSIKAAQDSIENLKKTPLSLTDLINIYQKKDITYAKELLGYKGYKEKGKRTWTKGKFTLTIDASGVISVEATSADGFDPFPDAWDPAAFGYKSSDSGIGMVSRTDYHKSGSPVISKGGAMESWVFCVGRQADM